MMLDETMISTTEAVKKSSTGLIDLCSLCSCQFSTDSFLENLHSQSSDDYLIPQHPYKVEQIVSVFLADNDEKCLQLKLCPSCKCHCDQLLLAQRKLSYQIDHITTLLLQNSRFTQIQSKNTIIAELFSDYHIHYFSSPSHSGLLTSLGNQNVGVHSLIQESREEIFNLDGDIEEQETKSHSVKVTCLRQGEEGDATESDGVENESDKDSSSSFYSSLPSLVSLDSFCSTQKDNLSNSIMNVNISVLESSGSESHEQTLPNTGSISMLLKSEHGVSNISNLIANTTNDELEVCFSNKIQRMKQHRVKEKNTEGSTNTGNLNTDRIFRLPLPRKASPIPSPTKTLPLSTTLKQKAWNGRKKKNSPEGDKVSANKDFVCSLCPKTSETRKDLNTHIDAHHKISNFICDICGTAYRHKSGLQSHIAIHRGDAKYRCEHCQKQFTQKAGLDRHHEAIHKKSRNYECGECGRTFRYHSSFNLHKQSHKETPDKKFRCEVPLCRLSFFTSYHLKRHQKTHTGDKPYECSICFKTFSEKYNLESHSKIHQTQEPVISTSA